MDKEKKKYRVSFSEYSTYMSCKHKWYLNYFLRWPGDVNEELIFGSALHNTIEEILSKPMMTKLYNGDRSSLVKNLFRGFLQDELKRVNDEQFLMKFKNQNLGQIFMFQAEKLLMEWDFFKRFKDYEVADVEFKLDDMLLYSDDEMEITYKGFIDLVLRNKEDGSYLIMDWKTSKVPWDIAKKLKDNKHFFAQLCLYKHFYAEAKGIPIDDISTKFYNFPRDKPKDQSPYTGNLKPEYIEMFMGQFIDVCKEIVAKKYDATNFEKVKFHTKQNFCHRCKFNTPDFCSDMEPHQVVQAPPPDLAKKSSSETPPE